MPETTAPPARDPRIDPKPGDRLQGMNQQKTVLKVGNTKDIAWYAPDRKEPQVRFRRKNGTEDATSLSAWQR